MPQFECETVDKNGKIRLVTIDAETEREAYDELDDKMSRYSSDYHVISVNPVW